MSGGPARAGARRVDLHAHTLFSDGQLTPEALIARALERELYALAITDHDTVEGVPRAIAAAPATLVVVPGIEISTSLDGADLHVLGYFVRPGDATLDRRLAGFREERRQRALAILERLEALGAPVGAAEVFAAAEPGVVGRPHVAAALVRAGHVPSVDVAFQRYLGPRGAAFIPRPAFSPREAIAVIRAAGGAAVLAHPPGSLADSTVVQLAGEGLAGLEVWHPQHGATAHRRWRALAKRLGLIETGGSDFHGTHRGADLGDMPVPERAVDELRAAASAA